MRNHDIPSTRAQTRQSGQFVRSTPGSQSLARGMRLLRAFLGGATQLTNAELAERCALPRPTVSRLTRALVEGGFLEFDVAQSVYRLSPVHLSLAAIYQQDHPAFAQALPLLRESARKASVNLGLLVRDGLQMVYLASYREAGGPVRRLVGTGSRIPIERYASGHALIADLPPAAREALLAQLAEVHGQTWPRLARQIQRSIAQCQRQGHCTFQSVPGLWAMATALRAPDGTPCALVLTVPADGAGAPATRWPRLLKSLARDVQARWPPAA